MRTATKHLADALLGEPVERWLLERDSAGLSLREIARELSTATGGKVAISHSTVALWLTEARTEPISVSSPVP